MTIEQIEFTCPDCECVFTWHCTREPNARFRLCATGFGKVKESDVLGVQGHPKYCPTCGAFDIVRVVCEGEDCVIVQEEPDEPLGRKSHGADVGLHTSRSSGKLE